MGPCAEQGAHRFYKYKLEYNYKKSSDIWINCKPARSFSASILKLLINNDIIMCTAK